MRMFWSPFSPDKICTPEIIASSYPGADIFRLYSLYGWLSLGLREYSKGGAASSMFSV